jgi:xanthine dehydrogenase accessory factor
VTGEACIGHLCDQINLNLRNIGNMKNLYLQLLDHHADISLLALATVTSSHGSTPQKPGSSAIFGFNGLIAGTVGGGVVEGRVQKLAAEALNTKTSGHFSFNLANDISNKEEAICGGQISVLIDANLQNSIAVFEAAGKSLERKIPGVLITMVTRFSEKSVLINRYWMNSSEIPPIPPEFLEKIAPAVTEMIKGGDPSDYRELELNIPGEEPSSLFLLEPLFPTAHLVIAGAGHIGKAVAHLADLLDFEITVVDDRHEFANSDNIPEADHIIVDEIGKALGNLQMSSDTYLVIVTRGHRDDASALKACIGLHLAYTGMIGSKNKIASMRADFIKNGLATTDQWDKIYSPIGIYIKSRSVEEIAISIAAQLVLVRNSRNN